MFSRSTGQPMLPKGGVFQPAATPKFGTTPGINPMASQPGMVSRIAEMGQQAGQQMGQRMKSNRDDPRRRQMLAAILSNGGMNNGIR